MRTDRLIIRDWSEDDAPAALEIYGSPEVGRWLSPALQPVPDLDTMRVLLGGWAADTGASEAALGHWAVTVADGGALVGGVTLHPLPVEEQDVEIGYQIAPQYWGLGYAAEAARAVIRRAFALDVDEVFALVRPANARAAAAARRVGMTWVGQTDKYYGLRLEVYRVRSADDAPGALREDPLPGAADPG